MNCRMRSRAASRGMPYKAATISRYSNPVSDSNTAPDSGTKPTWRFTSKRRAADQCPQIVAVPLRRLDHAGQHFERGRLPGPVRPQKSDNLAGRDLERQLVDGDLLAEDFCQLLKLNHEGDRRRKRQTPRNGSRRILWRAEKFSKSKRFVPINAVPPWSSLMLILRAAGVKPAVFETATSHVRKTARVKPAARRRATGARLRGLSCQLARIWIRNLKRIQKGRAS